MKTAVAVLVLLVASGRDLHPVGLLVVLHGDDAGASSAFLDWRERHQLGCGCGRPPIWCLSSAAEAEFSHDEPIP